MSPAAGKPLEAERFETLLRERSASSHLALSPEVVAALAAYLAELDRWRRRMNLTGPLSGSELADHAVESLAGLEAVPTGADLIDVGSGAGFPGLPIGIARPDVSAMLAEPRAKRAAFLRHVLRKLDLRRIVVYEGRVEGIRRSYDIAVSRAVGGSAGWLERPSFLRREGRMMLWTTAQPPVLPRFELEKSIPVSGSSRRIVAIYRIP